MARVNKNKGNAGKGRPKGSLNKINEEALMDKVGTLARQWTRENIELFATLAHGRANKDQKVNPKKISKNEHVRLRCAENLLLRGWGNPPQNVDIDVKVKQDVSVTYTKEQLEHLSPSELWQIWREQNSITSDTEDADTTQH